MPSSIDKALSGAVVDNWYAKSMALLCLSLQPENKNRANTNRNMTFLLFINLYLEQSYAIITVDANIKGLFLLPIRYPYLLDK